MTYCEVFQEATGHPPYKYQEEVAALIKAGRNVIITAPTGAGKTLAAVLPFLSTWKQPTCPGDRLLYVTPLRILARTLHDETTKAARRLFGDPRVVTSAVGRRWDADIFYIAQQMGGIPEDPYFVGDATFTTVDQLLSSALFHPVSLPRRLATIPAGALAGAYLVFDEIHLLEPEKSLATTLALLRMLAHKARFALMTATLSRSAREYIASKWQAELVELSDEERLSLPAEKSRKRSWQWLNKPLDAPAIRELHEGRTLVVVNTVERAQRLYEALRRDPLPECEVLLLHSRFLSHDRKLIENRVLELFGRNQATSTAAISTGAPSEAPAEAILIATQVVEVGLDISADCLLTEVAPANALIQRAGRCARWGGRGRVVVFSLPLEASSLPYDSGLVETTARLLADLEQEQVVDFGHEQMWIEAVHSKPEKEFLQHLHTNEHISKMFLAIGNKANQAAVRELVRDVSAVPVIVTDSPQEVWNTPAGPWPELVSVGSQALRAALKKLDKKADETLTAERPPIAWVPQLSEEEEGPLTWQWKPATPEEVGAAWVLALSPTVASYSPDTGLVLGKPGSPMPVLFVEPATPAVYSYRRETWEDHATQSCDKAKHLIGAHQRGLELLARAYGLPAETLVKCILFCALLHDTGKLTVTWQQWAHECQSRKGATADPSVSPISLDSDDFQPLAHTDYDPATEHDHRQVLKRPPHALLGALALMEALAQELPESLSQLALNAIARHHGVDVEQVGEFAPLTAGADVLAKRVTQSALLEPAGHEPLADWRLVNPPEHPDWAQYLSQNLLFRWDHREDREKWPLYTFVSRLVRLADQLATAEGSGRR